MKKLIRLISKLEDWFLYFKFSIFLKIARNRIFSNKFLNDNSRCSFSLQHHLTKLFDEV